MQSTIYVQEAQFLLMSYEAWLNEQASSASMNIIGALANYSQSNFQRGGNPQVMRGRRGRGSRDRGGGKSVCKWCGRSGHYSAICFHRFDQSFQGNRPLYGQQQQGNCGQFRNQYSNFQGNNSGGFNGSQGGNYQAHQAQMQLHFEDQLVDIFIKPLPSPRFDKLKSKLILDKTQLNLRGDVESSSTAITASTSGTGAIVTALNDYRKVSGAFRPGILSIVGGTGAIVTASNGNAAIASNGVAVIASNDFVAGNDFAAASNTASSFDPGEQLLYFILSSLRIPTESGKMENEDMINSMWNSNGSSSEFRDDSSSIGKEKVVNKGVRVGGKKGSKKSDC
ncbi:hypothetical protein ACOSP7_032158 [Xanthoceras sorbifolium]